MPHPWERTNPDPDQAVAAAVALLDQQKPGWRESIDKDRFDIRHGYIRNVGDKGCVLAQVYLSYGHGVFELFGGFKSFDARPVEFGFTLYNATLGDPRNDPHWDALQAAWERVL